MLIPFISVTAIGLWAALSRPEGTAPDGSRAGRIGAGVACAWLGFVGGAVVGMVVGWLLPFGFWAVLGGHLAAWWLAHRAVANHAAMAAATS